VLSILHFGNIRCKRFGLPLHHVIGADKEKVPIFGSSNNVWKVEDIQDMVKNKENGIQSENGNLINK